MTLRAEQGKRLESLPRSVTDALFFLETAKPKKDDEILFKKQEYIKLILLIKVEVLWKASERLGFQVFK